MSQFISFLSMKWVKEGLFYLLPSKVTWWWFSLCLRNSTSVRGRLHLASHSSNLSQLGHCNLLTCTSKINSINLAILYSSPNFWSRICLYILVDEENLDKRMIAFIKIPLKTASQETSNMPIKKAWGPKLLNNSKPESQNICKEVLLYRLSLNISLLLVTRLGKVTFK